jgi:GDP-fucose transporter C1
MLPRLEFDLKVAKAIAPLTVVYLAMIVFNNLCLQYVQVSFYQVARSLTVLWTALFEKVILGKSISRLRMTAVGVVFAGFVIGSKGEASFDWFGLFFGVLASIFVALYGIYVKKVLPSVEGNQWRLLIYNTTIAIVFLFPFVILTGEISILDPLKTLDLDFYTWMGILATGVTGWLINIAIFMQIKYTSPLTNAISGTVKAAVQTLLGVVFFKNVITNMVRTIIYHNPL